MDFTHFVIFHHKEVCFSLTGFQFIASEKDEMDGCANLSTLSSTRFSWNSLPIFSEVIDADVMTGKYKTKYSIFRAKDTY